MTTARPKGIQRRRAKGWQMPAGAIYVGRPTGFGNPFKVGMDGTAQRCVDLYGYLLAGNLCLSSKATVDDQKAALKFVAEHLEELRGHDLACWCRLGKPCHRDILLKVANAKPGVKVDLKLPPLTPVCA